MKEINSSEFELEVLQSGKVILDFYSTECPPCEALASKFEDLSKLYGKDVKFLKIFRQQSRDLADNLGIKSSPTLLFFDNGKEVADRLSGGIKRSDIILGLNSMLSPDRVEHIKTNIKSTVSEFDVIILGAGPGGLTAGLYLCQSKVNTVLIDIALPGGQVSTTHEVSNEDMQTNIPGIYAVGDVISKKYRQITTAVADGTIAAMAIAKELN